MHKLCSKVEMCDVNHKGKRVPTKCSVSELIMFPVFYFMSNIVLRVLPSS